MEMQGKFEQENEALDIIYEISQILDCKLDKQEIKILIQLCELGVNPEALAMCVKELKRESAVLKASEVPRKNF